MLEEIEEICCTCKSAEACPSGFPNFELICTPLRTARSEVQGPLWHHAMGCHLCTALACNNEKCLVVDVLSDVVLLNDSASLSPAIQGMVLCDRRE